MKVFIQTKTKTRHVFGSKFNCLEQLLCSLHRSLVTGTFRASDVDFLWFFCAFSGAFSRSLGAILLAQLAGNHASRAEAPLVRSTSPVMRRCGRSVTRTLTGPLGARLRFTSELSRAEPMSSDRMSRNQYVAYSKHSVSGVTMDSANLIKELIAWASFSAQTNCESPCHLQEDILHPDNLPAPPQFTGHTQQDARSVTSRFCGFVAVFLLCGFCLLLVFVLVFLLWFGSLFFRCGFPF